MPPYSLAALCCTPRSSLLPRRPGVGGALGWRTQRRRRCGVTDEGIAVIAPGAMGGAIAARLHENGGVVHTVLAGRSAASRRRAEAAGMVAEPDDTTLVAKVELVLSIVPPGDALTLAERLRPV